jgi:hypothetical protein
MTLCGIDVMSGLDVMTSLTDDQLSLLMRSSVAPYSLTAGTGAPLAETLRENGRPSESWTRHRLSRLREGKGVRSQRRSGRDEGREPQLVVTEDLERDDRRREREAWDQVVHVVVEVEVGGRRTLHVKARHGQAQRRLGFRCELDLVGSDIRAGLEQDVDGFNVLQQNERPGKSSSACCEADTVQQDTRRTP